VIGQIVTYLTAEGYYSAFLLTPDQLGITPFNTLTRLSLTEGEVICVILIVALTTTAAFQIRYQTRAELTITDSSGSATWRFPHKMKRNRMRIVLPKERLTLSKTEQAAVIIFMIFALVGFCIAAYAVGVGAGDHYRDEARNVFRNSTFNFIGIAFDPPTETAHWINPNEFPSKLLGADKVESSLDLRIVGVLGIDKGLYYLYDERTGVVLTVPVNQVQLGAG
jgi:hypothetical protein